MLTVPMAHGLHVGTHINATIYFRVTFNTKSMHISFEKKTKQASLPLPFNVEQIISVQVYRMVGCRVCSMFIALIDFCTDSHVMAIAELRSAINVESN